MASLRRLSFLRSLTSASATFFDFITQISTFSTPDPLCLAGREVFAIVETKGRSGERQSMSR